MDISDFLRPDFVLLWLGLLALGAMLKYWAKDKDGNRIFDPNLIPVVLYVVGTTIGALTWAADHRGISGWPWWYNVVITGGLLNGGTAAWLANGGWDFFHGIWKFGIKVPEDGYADKIIAGKMSLVSVPIELQGAVRKRLAQARDRIVSEVGA